MEQYRGHGLFWKSGFYFSFVVSFDQTRKMSMARLEIPPPEPLNEVPDMPDRVKEPMNQALLDQRANLMYLLQEFSRVAGSKRDVNVQSEIPEDQIAECESDNGLCI